MKVCLIGHKGNMGKRYSAILNLLKVDWFGVDIDEGSLNQPADAYLIVTPTHTHVDMISWLRDLGKPILCEKPITKNLVQLEKLLYDCEKSGTKLQMVSQYDYLIDESRAGNGDITCYNYFKHGGDGIFWDCINIIYHARGSVTLTEDSPIWYCWINGQQIDGSQMDVAYIKMIEDWLKNPRTDIERIWKSHEKVATLEAECKRS